MSETAESNLILQIPERHKVKEAAVVYSYPSLSLSLSLFGLQRILSSSAWSLTAEKSAVGPRVEMIPSPVLP